MNNYAKKFINMLFLPKVLFFNIAINFKIEKKICKLLSAFFRFYHLASIHDLKYATIVISLGHFCFK